jgi:hypothetical protein
MAQFSWKELYCKLFSFFYSSRKLNRKDSELFLSQRRSYSWRIAGISSTPWTWFLEAMAFDITVKLSGPGGGKRARWFWNPLIK